MVGLGERRVEGLDVDLLTRMEVNHAEICLAVPYGESAALGGREKEEMAVGGDLR